MVPFFESEAGLNLLCFSRGASCLECILAGGVASIWISDGLTGFCDISSCGFGGFSFATTANHVGGRRECCGHGNDGLFHFADYCLLVKQWLYCDDFHPNERGKTRLV